MFASPAFDIAIQKAKVADEEATAHNNNDGKNVET